MPRPEEVVDVAIAGRVAEVEDGVAGLQFSGRIRAEHTYNGKVSRAWASFRGVGRFEVATGRMLSLALIAEGVNVPAHPYAEEKPIAAAVEWRRAVRPDSPARPAAGPVTGPRR
jgi:hypothetical protein